ncbi:HlyD family efflux transporter periplasmic adaptor subunit [Azospirillum agricola]|uniref:HlyD family efflux transporter periplasmic adaptor subunit n=1 Tax=Azospirillum agricola TaxID=1720247 RepID=UPI000A0EFF73|nr:HlyD family efflux transporter periplasmic adaptor subunit [Azospirillum agricola]SMH43094.1 putative peptide zinc metalloprotease protein [Azospirillum lipoferum]SMH48740.1 putative peptide zinc metalloprotease protein [Azospirillum lipoferum]
MSIALTGSAAAPSPGRNPPDKVRLPALRDDLALLPAPAGLDGAPGWTIHDPVRNRYFRIGPQAFALIAHWHLGAPRAIAAAVAAESLFEATDDDVMGFYQFLAANNLTVTADTAYLARQAAARETGWIWWLIHNYLFFRVPLLRPDRFLSATVGWVAPFYSRTWLTIVLLAGVAGLLLAARQWDAFLHTFQHFFSPEGLALYGVTLISTKILHELGHAYTAKRFGCRVPTMGVAFLVMWPVLYTDTTDAWRLVSRRQRLAVGAAGMLTELTIAVFATLAWSFLPDGPLRSAAYFLATVSWVTTLAINLSPFMRFDGYYLLSDALDVPNLQDRAFALARWRLREWLFGLGEPAPEQMPPRLRTTLLVYAYVTWVYRLVLFLGIALLVYHVAIKVLGILLFAIEIGWFVARPLFAEFRAWWGLRDRFRANGRTLLTLLGLSGAVGLAVLPVTTTVSVPVVWRSSGFATIYAPFPARLEETLVRPGQTVAEGELLFRLSAPDLDGKLRQATLRIDWMQDQIARLSSSREQLDRLRAMEEDLAAALAERQGLLDSRTRLEVRAPLSGTVTDLEDALLPGRWLSPKLPLATVVSPGAGELVGYVGEGDFDRLQPGAAARFHPDDPLRARIGARVRAVDPVSVAVLDVPALASLHGGPVAVEGQAGPAGPGAVSSRAALTPVEAVYRIAFDVESGGDAAKGPPRVTRGVARVEGEARSLAERFWRAAAAVLIRETGF